MPRMNCRERWLALLEGRRPDRIPTDYMSTDEFHGRFKRDLGCETDEAMFEQLHVDFPASINVALEPKREHEPSTDDTVDMWGIGRASVAYGTGAYNEVVHNPLGQAQTISDVEAFDWPEADDFTCTINASPSPTPHDTRIVRGGVYEPFLLVCAMRGLERAFEDLILNPPIIEAMLDHIFAFNYAINRRLFEAAGDKIDLFYLAEDLGGQHGPLMSLEMYRRFLLPHQVRMAELARQHDVHVYYHTDGASRIFLPDLIDVVGIEVLNPIQWRCPGMECASLVRDFGDKVVFHGAMDNQQTLPFGTVDDVRAEVRDHIKAFENARWVCAPCHNIQANTPTQNVVAMYEAIHELGALT